jgi:hypothetical protein
MFLLWLLWLLLLDLLLDLLCTDVNARSTLPDLALQTLQLDMTACIYQVKRVSGFEMVEQQVNAWMSKAGLRKSPRRLTERVADSYMGKSG